MKLSISRALVDAINNGSLETAEYETFPVFNLQIPKSCPGVPPEVLNPRNTWADGASFEAHLRKLAHLFAANFAKFADKASPEIAAAGPTVA